MSTRCQGPDLALASYPESPWTVIPFTPTYGASLLKYYATLTADLTLGSTSNGYPAAPYCLNSTGPAWSSASSKCDFNKMLTAMLTEPVQVYSCHGNGTACANYYHKSEVVLLDSKMGYKINQLNQNPILILDACDDGDILGANQLPQYMLLHGASAYVGYTSITMASFAVLQAARIINTFSPSYAQGSTYTIGQAYLAAKQQGESGPKLTGDNVNGDAKWCYTGTRPCSITVSVRMGNPIVCEVRLVDLPEHREHVEAVVGLYVYPL